MGQYSEDHEATRRRGRKDDFCFFPFVLSVILVNAWSWSSVVYCSLPSFVGVGEQWSKMVLLFWRLYPYVLPRKVAEPLTRPFWSRRTSYAKLGLKYPVKFPAPWQSRMQSGVSEIQPVFIGYVKYFVDSTFYILLLAALSVRATRCLLNSFTSQNTRFTAIVPSLSRAPYWYRLLLVWNFKMQNFAGSTVPRGGYVP